MQINRCSLIDAGDSRPREVISVMAVCGRFTSLTPVDELAEYFEADPADELSAESFVPNYNVAPTTRIFVVASSPTGGRRLGRMKWGLVPSWSKEARGSGLINARSETVADKPSFRDSFRTKRCLIPMSGYYEWRTIDVPAPEPGTKAVKSAVYVTRVDGAPMAVAGLWAHWKDRGDPGSVAPLVSCCVVTRDSVGVLAHVHDRMPVLVGKELWREWLEADPKLEDPSSLLREILDRGDDADSQLVLTSVGSRVNSIRHNGPDLITPTTDS